MLPERVAHIDSPVYLSVASVAAIALGLASLTDDVADDLPPSLHHGLENGAYGRDWPRALDARLAAARFGPIDRGA